MKFTAIFLLAASLQVSANSYSQKVTLSQKNAVLEKVFRSIKKQTGYSFFFDVAWLQKASPVTIDVKEASLQAALDICFKDQPLTYSIVGNTIVVKLKNPALRETASSLSMLPPQADIKGVITDAEGKPLEGASVKIKGTTRGVVTNARGEFVIKADPSDVLEISSVGYKDTEIKVGNNKSLGITLQPANKALEEVVVTALGISKLDKKLGYAVTTVKGEEITRTNTVNPITALQGKVAGVSINVTSASGIQSSPNIQIRGARVLGNTPGQSNNQPIFVVDGNILQNNIQDADNADAGSQLKNLNPDDYESITVLKGAAATSIYGSRGLNGAVVITTKKGRAGSGLGIEFTTTYQTSNIYKSPIAYQNVYGQGSATTREGAFAPDGSQANTLGSWGPLMDGSLHPAIYDKSKKVPFSPLPDNWKTFYQDGNYINNNIAISGAGEKFHYRLSYSNNSSKGMLPNNGLKRNAIDLKIGGNINKVFSTEMGVSYANTVTSNYFSQGRYYWTGGQNLGFYSYYLPRNIDYADWKAVYRRPDNTVNTTDLFTTALTAAASSFARIDKNNFNRYENSLLGYLQLKAQVTSWLDLSGKANVNVLKIYSEEKNYGNGINNTGGYYGSSGSYSTDYTLLFMAHVARTAMNNDLGIDFRLVNEIYGNRLGESYGANTNGGLTVPNQFFLGNSLQNYQNNVRYGLTKPSMLTVGVAGILNLSYKEYLNLELTGRNDWLSTLTYPVTVPGANNYSVFYPSVNLSYSFYDQFKNKMPSWLSSGRLRASLAYVGNAGVAGPFTTGNGYSPSTIINQNGQSVGTATQYNASIKPNLNLKPQVSRSLELGTNFSLFKDLVNVDFAWYKTNTFDQLLTLPSVTETGYSQVYLNAGNIQNKGFEVLVNVKPIRKKDWSLEFSVNAGANKSKIIEFGNGIKEWELSGGYDGANVWAYEGGDFGVLTADLGSAAKIDPKTGLPLIVYGGRLTNTNPATKYDIPYYYTVSPDLTPTQKRISVGKVEPSLVGGFNTTVRYKNFSLFAQVDGRFGGDVYSESYNYAMAQGTLLQTLEFRDQAHGGLARTDSYSGQTRYDGVIPNGVFDAGQMSPLNPTVSIAGMTFREAYAKGLVEPMKASLYYAFFHGYGTNLNTNGSVTRNSWIMLRELSLGYRLPVAIANKIHLKGARFTFTARNIGYLYKTLQADQNPESLQGNDSFRPYIAGGVPFYRNFAVSVNISL